MRRHTVDAVEKRRGVTERDPNAAHAAQLADALKLDMADYWQPTAEGYFGRVSKEQTLAAIEEVGGSTQESSCSGLKKDALAKTAERNSRATLASRYSALSLRRTGDQLRLPSPELVSLVRETPVGAQRQNRAAKGRRGFKLSPMPGSAFR